jgi:hypothetical protein
MKAGLAFECISSTEFNLNMEGFEVFTALFLRIQIFWRRVTGWAVPDVSKNVF